MKNRNIVHASREATIYRDYYKPSVNVWRFFKSILSVLLFGRSIVARTYIPAHKRIIK